MKKNKTFIFTSLLYAATLFNIGCSKDSQYKPLTTDKTPEATNSTIEPQVNGDPEAGGILFLSQSEYENLPLINSSEASNLPQSKLEFVEDGQKASGVKTIYMPSVRSQGNEGSCVAWTFGYHYASWTRRAFYGESNAYSYGYTISPEYIHNNCKLSGSCEQGCYMTTVLNFMKNTGSPRMYDFPMDYYNCSLKYSSKSKYKFRGWYRINKTVAEIKSWIDYGYPIAIALTVDQNFYNQTYNYPYTLHSRGGANYGGHAVTIIGYNDTKQAFKVQNQWGNVQDNGYFYISYNSVSSIIQESYIAW